MLLGMDLNLIELLLAFSLSFKIMLRVTKELYRQRKKAFTKMILPYCSSPLSISDSLLPKTNILNQMIARRKNNLKLK